MNQQLFSFFYNLSNHSPAFDAVIRFIGGPLSYIIIPFVLLLYFLTRKHKRMFWFSYCFLTIVATWFTTKTFKEVFRIQRPYLLHDSIVPLVMPGDFSFPSLHAAIYSALAVVFLNYNKKAGIFFTLIAVVVGLSRIIAGVHMPIDVLAGWGVGIVVALIIRFFFKRLE